MHKNVEMKQRITGISSMATRQVLTDLAAGYEAASGHAVAFEAVGGVDAAKRVQAGEAFDLVVLAADAIDRLLASGHLTAGSRVDLVRSPVAVAVKAKAAGGPPHPDIATEQALRHAVLDARSLGYSTGPSGTYLMQLFQRWGIADALARRIVQAPPGVPVGQLVARGEVELGFQQLSELMHLDGIDVVGTLPSAVAYITTFSCGRCAAGKADAKQEEAIAGLLAYMNSAQAAALKRRHGMEPV
jgi:molybdate transport system substrate-binding protein